MKDKFTLEIPIAGILKKIDIEEIDINKLILDEENPRIGYWKDNILMIEEDISQGDLETAIIATNIDDYNRLKRSIETSEGIMQEIWVYPVNGNYKIIDGNTRLLIYKDLSRKYPHKEKYKKIRAKVLPKDISEEDKNFIRLIAHLRGENPWGAYERARMLYILWYRRGYTDEELVNKTRLSLNDIRRWREAYQNMELQFLPIYSHNLGALNKFSYFVEYENKIIKEGMNKNELTISDFCSWVGNDEIEKAQDVRLLRKIFANKKAVEILKEDGFKEAKKELAFSVPSVSSPLFSNIEKVIIGLGNMTRSEEEDIIAGEEEGKKELLIRLYEELKKIIKRIED